MTTIFIVSFCEVDRALKAIQGAARDGVIENHRLQIWRQHENLALFCFHPSQPDAGKQWVPITWESATPPKTLGAATYVFYTKSVQRLPINLLRNRGISVEVINDIHSYFVPSSKVLRKNLALEHLWWLDQAIENVASFRHAGWRIDGSHAPELAVRTQAVQLIDAWIKQFECFGARQVGETLVRLLTVARPELLIPQLDLHAVSESKPNFLSSLTGVGKSGPVILHTVQKHVGSPQLGCIGEGITFHAEKNIQEPLHVFEDGLWTGFEFQKVLDALTGKKQHQAIKTLTCNDWLRQVRIHLHFLVATDIGLATIGSILRENGLDRNIVVSQTPPVLLNVLRAEAKQKFMDGHYDYTHVIADKIPSSEIYPAILNVKRPWLDQDLLGKLSETILAHAGHLYKVPEKLTEALHSEWPFGASWIGSNIVFSHGVPRAAVPFYWAKAKIPKKHKVPIDWQPIVPETTIDVI